LKIVSQRDKTTTNFNQVKSHVEDTGEVNWLVQDAINEEISIPVISQSMMELFKSRTKDSDAYKAIATMRHGFGVHRLVVTTT
jgi:6-phosphogluconate dehydrogenase